MIRVFKKLIKSVIRFFYRFCRAVFRLLPVSQSLKNYFKYAAARELTKWLRSRGYIVSTEADDYKNYAVKIFETGARSEEFKEYKENHITFSGEDVKPIAFYLPQYYTFPENDKWWGKGFTEWTNVTKAVPQFLGHYQPHLPYDMPFYDLSGINIMKEQVKLAKNYGIYGFCFYYYWFGGKRLLDKPLDNFLNSKEGFDFPFCLLWANENWTRRWDGMDNEILIAQKHSKEDDLACIADICKYVKDERYIRINGRPLIIIYNPDRLPNANNTIKIWKKYCRDNGIGEICLAATNVSSEASVSYNFDEALEFPPNGIVYKMPPNVKAVPINPEFNCDVFDMEKYVSGKLYYPEHKAYLSAFPCWDNTARRGANSYVFQMTPKIYKQWISDIIRHTKENREIGDRFVFINAWNEWAEAAHLEPCRKYGYANLQATADAVMESKMSKE